MWEYMQAWEDGISVGSGLRAKNRAEIPNVVIMELPSQKLILIKQKKSLNGSVKTQRLKAAWENRYLLKSLNPSKDMRQRGPIFFQYERFYCM